MTKLNMPKTMLCEELIMDICEIVHAGNFRLTACRRIGLSYNTFRRWVSIGRQEIEKYKEGDPQTMHMHLVISLEASESVLEQCLVQDVVTGDLKSKIWFLEHRWNKKYTRNTNVVLDDEEAELTRVDPLMLLADKLRELKTKMDGTEE